MEGNRGVTIASLTIYVIAMLIVIATIATITSFFYTNVNNLDTRSQNISEITKFNMYFLEETKKNGNKTMGVSDKQISFSSGNIYTFQDNSIYLNNIRICENVKNVIFSIEKKENREIISVLITIGDNLEYTKTTKYVSFSNS